MKRKKKRRNANRHVIVINTECSAETQGDSTISSSSFLSDTFVMKIGVVVDSLKQAVVFTTAVTVVIICRKGVACETKNKMINGMKRKEEIIPAISILFFSFFNLFFFL
ncbi:hypothetical protein, unlikely [Trypanosoma brucei gambiense DAL972]|uniref:Uncharacterized protein n=1 Tax=Trypanosoma brucei gambiense (strain MHOM/CI/86/DAL972) TaxID=679716 RepID=C9ZZ17_TRYB9|nr:hypothetical protein, unlikely [Trypanosoma brucei gambiense DAL972]CBH14666.1 hypothetical protein, unlikely [Trypanosoma brucei gambiense DAL972]|eukprot:XP_011776932.1 hypothetical protein, unlikely [Trypanosoma brucei gambiense DAL972]